MHPHHGRQSGFAIAARQWAGQRLWKLLKGQFLPIFGYTVASNAPRHSIDQPGRAPRPPCALGQLHCAVHHCVLRHPIAQAFPGREAQNIQGSRLGPTIHIAGQNGIKPARITQHPPRQAKGAGLFGRRKASERRSGLIQHSPFKLNGVKQGQRGASGGKTGGL